MVREGCGATGGLASGSPLASFASPRQRPELGSTVSTVQPSFNGAKAKPPLPEKVMTDFLMSTLYSSRSVPAGRPSGCRWPSSTVKSKPPIGTRAPTPNWRKPDVALARWRSGFETRRRL